ncbi:MAG: hypothetical protein ACI9UA_005516, partial [Pseudoalteromonas tetraodonis]
MVLWLLAVSGEADESLIELRPFLKQHCFECHGAEKQKGEIRLDTLGNDLAKHENLEIWQNVLDQLNLGEMPPKKAQQPSKEEVAPVVKTLTSKLAEAYAQARSTGGHTVLRRLNRHELRNSLRDLLYLNGADYRPDSAGSRLIDNNGNGSVERTGSDPLRFFPEDEEDEGFFNLGDRLVMSDFLLKLTLGAVEETLAQATHLEPKPAVETRNFSGHLLKGSKQQQGEDVIQAVSRELHSDYEMLMRGYERFGRLAPFELRGGVGVSARYRITLEISAHNAQHPWAEMIELDAGDPFQLCLNIADAKNGGIAGVTSTPLALWSLPANGAKKKFSYEVWMDKTWTPWIGWENGPTDRAFRAEKVVEKYQPENFTPRPEKKTNKEAHDQWPRDMAKVLFEGGYPGPHLRVHSLSVEPLIDTWPPRSHTELYGSGSGSEKEIRQLMARFAQRAFRRPVEVNELEPYIQLVLQQQVEPVVRMPGGITDLSYRVYEGKWNNLPEFDTLEPVVGGKLPKGLIDIRAAKRKEYYGIVFEGKLDAPRAGEFLFEMASDDGARILIDGKKVLEHDGLHGAELKKAKLQLEAGEHSIRVEYLAYGAPNSFRAGWSEPGSVYAQLSADSLRGSSNNQQKRSDDALPPFIRAMLDGYAA